MDDLQRAQSSLSRALGRARAGEDKELAQRVRDLGEQLSHMLTGLLRLTKVHDPGNKAFDSPVKEFGSALASLVELLGTVHLVAVEDQVYVNDIRTRDEGKGGQRDLGADLRRHNVGGLTFHAPLDQPQVRALVGILAAAAPPEGARAAVAARLAEAGITTVELQGIFRFQTARGAAKAERRAPVELVDRMLHAVLEAWNNLLAGRLLNPLPIRKVVMEALDAGIESPSFWLPYPEAPAHAGHAVQVCAVSLLLAKRAGFSLAFLQDLGISALTHDAGYVAVPAGAGAAGLGAHAFEGARAVLRQRGFSEAKVRRFRAVLEHHRDWKDPAGPPSIGAAILRVAEDYVNGARLYGTRVTRAEILGAMTRAAGTVYHPVLPQLLANALGKWPPGTPVEVDGKRWGYVAVPARSDDLWDKPLVRRIVPTTRALTDEWIDLAQGGELVRSFPG
jgi:hypothetical protein